MKKKTSFRNKFLKIFGDIKIFKFPFFLLYDPGSYKVKGNEVRTIIETIQKGDILVRGYSNYLDGHFIPGFFSHTGLYLGETKKNDHTLTDVQEENFHEGDQTVIHSMAEGVFMEDIISFCRCDYLVILRRSTKTESDFDIDQSFKAVYEKSIENLGKDYDFEFDFSEIGNLSCTELVFVCNQDFLPKYNVGIKERKVFFKKRQMIIPDDFVTKEFEIAFASKSIEKETLEEILRSNDV